ncbi:MAG TPA: mannitol dehydrogenase family protein [Castellaniella sp.]|uniref:mannitol dehydrogenase family protein n=1 Tax=Castellaniella sp. TaxID=1955812 RepID=UPI002EEA8627
MNSHRLNAAWLERARQDPSMSSGLALPGYDPAAHGVGIVHLGVGAFHRAHQAVYVDDTLARHGGDWRIAGISLRGSAVAASLNPQDGLYTLLVRDGSQAQGRVIGSIAHVTAAAQQPQLARGALIRPGVKVVTLTVTEKAYGLGRSSGAVLPDHPAVAHDLAHPAEPAGVLGMLVWALGERRRRGLAPFTVLCCDNLPSNGHLLRAGVLDFAGRVEPGLEAWIGANVAFPSTMVDRITPAMTEQTRADAASLVGCEDQAAVETEPFSMWVIEDNFPQGRPAWEDAGALMVSDVNPYERMKLRVLNGAHSLLAYAGHVAGHVYVRDAMRDEALSRMVSTYMCRAAETLQPVAGVDFADYAAALRQRFANPAIAHETYQIAMDGTEKLPQRILDPARDCLIGGQDLRPFAFAVAAWMRYCLGVTEQGRRYLLRDPRENEIRVVLQGSSDDARGIAAALMALPGVFPSELRDASVWRSLVVDSLRVMLSGGMAAALSMS